MKMLNSAKWHNSGCSCCNPGKTKKQLRGRENLQWQNEVLNELAEEQEEIANEAYIKALEAKTAEQLKWVTALMNKA